MSKFIPQPSCADPVESESLTPDEARQRIQDQITAISGWQKVAIRDALDEVLYENIHSPCQVPPHDNSAMDGYAFHSKDIIQPPFSLNLVGVAFAGQPFNGDIQSGQCIRIMTGAKLPADCDTVVMQEHVEVYDGHIVIHREIQAKQNVRYAGEDIQIDETILQAGHRLTPADIGLIASLGIGEISVHRPIRVAFFSTGDELCSIGSPLGDGEIYDSNRYTLFGMLKRLNVQIQDMGVIPDNPEQLRQALIQATQNADVIITSGGVSVGDADYIKPLLNELGDVDFWKLAIKPGRPLAFGKINQSLFFGLPGNPVSVMVTFYQFVQPALKRLSGEVNHQPFIINATTTAQIRKKPGRYEYQRGILFTDELGQLKVSLTGLQGSGILRSMSLANCFILLDADTSLIEAGSLVPVQPFSSIL